MKVTQENSKSPDTQQLKKLRDVGKLSYCLGNGIAVDQVVNLYRACTLGERRPIDDHLRMSRLLENSNLVITAWDGQTLVGLARSTSDFGWVTYLSDLAVRESHQRSGIGRELMRLTREAGGPQTTIVLLAAPAAEEYYPKCGFRSHPQAWLLRPEDILI